MLMKRHYHRQPNDKLHNPPQAEGATATEGDTSNGFTTLNNVVTSSLTYPKVIDPFSDVACGSG
ncbi:MAG: hypothetical protein AAGJ35_07795 [Myxococcota bacterium]